MIIIWFVLLFIFIGAYGLYYLYMKKASTRSWNLKIDKKNLPMVTVIVPLYNEEKTIEFKLENLLKLEYPVEKLQILLVDDASNDGTSVKITNFLKQHPLDLMMVTLSERHGKMKGLNKALEQVRGEVVIVSDCDVFLPSNTLVTTMPYFTDPSVGGVISKEALLDPGISWVSETENLYMKLTYGTIKLGESKIHSTLIFHGGFGAYRRSVLGQFNEEEDDVGTALDIVQKGSRTIMVPDAVSYSVEFTTWRDKFNSKIRRARHNIRTWIRCLNLLLRRRLLLPKRIALPEIFLYLFNPLIFSVLFITTIYILMTNLSFGILLTLVIVPLLVLKQTRLILFEVLQNNFFLLLGILGNILRKDLISWNTFQDPRTILKREMLEKKGLL
ncbi:glycosyltransferase [Candidatus Bathyarchaeota archaeon]|nr:glycosyltransferase [Candidatus Bathyarchaeota archaeon]